MNDQDPYGERDEVIVCIVLAFCIGNAIITLAYRLTALTMSDTPPELRPMLSFNPSEPAILHDRVTGAIEIWTGENEAEYRRNARTLPDGAVAWRRFVFDGWGNVLGG